MAELTEIDRLRKAIDGIGHALGGVQNGYMTEVDAWREIEVNLRATHRDPGTRPGFTVVACDELDRLRAENERLTALANALAVDDIMRGRRG